jgi:hypothetical protein
MIVKQYYLGCLAHASDLVADEGSAGAAVVDPLRTSMSRPARSREPPSNRLFVRSRRGRRWQSAGGYDQAR